MESIRLGQITLQELCFFPQNCFGFLGVEGGGLLSFLISYSKKNLSNPTNNCFLSFIFIILLNPILKQFKNPLKVSQIKNSI